MILIIINLHLQGSMFTKKGRKYRNQMKMNKKAHIFFVY